MLSNPMDIYIFYNLKIINHDKITSTRNCVYIVTKLLLY